jgi:hypothetical protein
LRSEASTVETIAPHELRELCTAFRDGLRSILSDRLYGVYLFGAVAFPGPAPTGDVDYHVILKGPLNGEQRAALEQLHASLAKDHPPLGCEMDGYYLLLEDALQDAPPRSQMWSGAIDKSWALHRQHIRSGRRIVLYGPDPNEIYTAPTWTELEEALYGELQYAEDHLADYPAYCILNLCRLVYSFETRHVVLSKAEAAAWAVEALPEWRGVVQLALKWYAGEATAADDQTILDCVGKLYRFATLRIRESQTRWEAGQAQQRVRWS